MWSVVVMMQAEGHPGVRIHELQSATGSSTIEKDGILGSFQILNYTQETIYITNYENRVTSIPANPIHYHNPRVEIIARNLKVRRQTNDSREIFDDNQFIIEIPIDVLRDDTIYSATCNRVLSIKHHAHVSDHPMSESWRRSNMEAIFRSAAREAAHAPFTIIANDPANKYDEIYVSIHGRICASRPTHFKNEPDVAMIIYRDLVPGAKETHRVVKSSFNELLNSHPTVWTLEDCILSPFRSELEEYLSKSMDPSSPKEQLIPLEYHNSVVKQERAFQGAERQRVEDENSQLKKRVSHLQGQVKELTEAEYSQRSAELKIQELSYKEQELARDREHFLIEVDQFKKKIAAEDRIRQHALEMEEAKNRRATIDSFTTGIKTFATILPIAIGLVKIFSPK